MAPPVWRASKPKGECPRDEPRAIESRHRSICPRAADPKRLHVGQAATVAGYAGPGFHNWPGSADVLVGESESASPHPVPCQKNVRRGVRRRTVAGYAGPGFHTWPSGHIPQDTAPKPLLRLRSTAKKTFGAATGVSDPRLQKTQTRNKHAGGKAATDRGRCWPAAG